MIGYVLNKITFLSKSKMVPWWSLVQAGITNLCRPVLVSLFLRAMWRAGKKKLTIMQLFDVFTKSFRPQSDFLIFFKKLGIITIGQPKRKYFQNLFSGSWKVSLVLFAACSIKLVENRVAYLLSWYLVQCTLFFLLGLLIGGSFIAVMAHVWNTDSRFVLGSNL